MPLLLAFYCIIGGNQRLPDRHADLYKKVINRMLTGGWRGSGNRDPEWDPGLWGCSLCHVTLGFHNRC